MPLEISRGTYYWRSAPGAARVRLGRSRREALDALPEAKRQARPLPPKPRPARQPRRRPRAADMWRRLRSLLYSSMRQRATARAMPMMTREEFDQLWERAAGRCEVTGLRFRLTKLPEKLKRPWAPSVDRKDSSLGYSFDNCRLVCTAVNLAMNEWGEETLLQIARALARK